MARGGKAERVSVMCGVFPRKVINIMAKSTEII
jgi:hypothetical protein